MKCLYVENVYTGILLSVKFCASEYVVYVKCNFFWVNIVQVKAYLIHLNVISKLICTYIERFNKKKENEKKKLILIVNLFVDTVNFIHPQSKIIKKLMKLPLSKSAKHRLKIALHSD